MGKIKGNFVHPHEKGKSVKLLIQPEDLVHNDKSKLKFKIVYKRFQGTNFIYFLKVSEKEILPVLDSSQNVQMGGSKVESNILRLYWGPGDMDNMADRSNKIVNRLYGISDLTFTNFGITWQPADDATNKRAL